MLGIIDDPVAIKSVELSIIDKAYEMGWMVPMPPPFRTQYKVAATLAGPAAAKGEWGEDRRQRRLTKWAQAPADRGGTAANHPNCTQLCHALCSVHNMTQDYDDSRLGPLGDASYETQHFTTHCRTPSVSHSTRPMTHTFVF